MDRLERLENDSIRIIREAYATVRNLGMLWSIGKDSTVMLWLARKAFFGHVPLPLVHIDTSFKIPEMIRYRDELVREWGLQLIVGRNDAAIEAGKTFPQNGADRITCCGALKTFALKAVVEEAAFGGLLLGIRADEEGTRSKERIFSPRTAENSWEIASQPAEIWGYYNTVFPPGAHVRVHPLLDWTELDIWEYIGRESIPAVSLYFNQGDGKRYRSLGCAPCTVPISSKAKTVADIIAELKHGALVKIPERSGRAQDKDDGGTLERLRKDGYM